MNMQEPLAGSPCPQFCQMHVDGRHVGEFAGPGHVGEGYHVYARRSMGPDGVDSVETVVTKEDGPERRVIIALNGDPQAVIEKPGPVAPDDHDLA
ncbi:hypothetical protein KBX50_08415 [Micromonospora sp. C51]|uniref:hypothetical protein n=1 Tax=Micromonospora sp. C51 TaxID=2824879 RepID=UPI001B3588FD|nr:hypothetical protein [Micromonospora sp. C51]MBQ1048486.1 hypothetical protein [Micromonospora sp. C51]